MDSWNIDFRRDINNVKLIATDVLRGSIATVKITMRRVILAVINIVRIINDPLLKMIIRDTISNENITLVNVIMLTLSMDRISIKTHHGQAVQFAEPFVQKLFRVCFVVAVFAFLLVAFHDVCP